MNRTLNFLSILGLIGLCIKLSIDQHLSVELIAVTLVGAVFVFSRDGWLSVVLKICISLFSIAYMLVGYAYSMKEFLALSACLGALVVALFGFFVMFGGLEKGIMKYIFP